MSSPGYPAVIVDAKICGLTRPGDAELAVRHGATRLGVVFAWGPRVVSATQAAEIVAAAGGVPVLAVVATTDAHQLGELAAATGVRGFQLHGGSDPALAATLRRAGFEVWRVAPIAGGGSAAETLRSVARDTDAVLVEPRLPGNPGGRGVPLDLTLAREARAALAGCRMVLAGGLGPGTVAEAIRLVGPDGVDVSSGVESAPGVKDPGLLQQFLEAVRDARPTARHRA